MAVVRELATPNPVDSRHIEEFFSDSVLGILEDHARITVGGTFGTHSVQAAYFVNRKGDYRLVYSAIDAMNGRETLGMALMDYELRTKFGADYGYRQRLGHKTLTLASRQYQRVDEGLPAVQRHDYIGKGGLVAVKLLPVSLAGLPEARGEEAAVHLKQEIDSLDSRQFRPIKPASNRFDLYINL